jgi:hypothetical protein
MLLSNQVRLKKLPRMAYGDIVKVGELTNMREDHPKMMQ